MQTNLFQQYLEFLDTDSTNDFLKQISFLKSLENQQIENDQELEEDSPKTEKKKNNMSHFSNYSNSIPKTPENSFNYGGDSSPSKRSSVIEKEYSVQNAIRKRNSQILQNLSKNSILSNFSPDHLVRSSDKKSKFNEKNKEEQIKKRSFFIAKNNIEDFSKEENILNSNCDSILSEGEEIFEIPKNLNSIKSLQISIRLSGETNFINILQENSHKKTNFKQNYFETINNSNLIGIEGEMNIREMKKNGFFKESLCFGSNMEKVYRKVQMNKLKILPFLTFCEEINSNASLKIIGNEVFLSLIKDSMEENNEKIIEIGIINHKSSILNNSICFSDFSSGLNYYLTVQNKTIFSHIQEIETAKRYLKIKKVAELTLIKNENNNGQRLYIEEKNEGDNNFIFAKIEHEKGVVLENNVFVLLKDRLGFYVDSSDIKQFDRNENYEFIILNKNLDISLEEAFKKKFEIIKIILMKKNDINVFEERKTIYIGYQKENNFQKNWLELGKGLINFKKCFLGEIRLKYECVITFDKDKWVFNVLSKEKTFNSLQIVNENEKNLNELSTLFKLSEGFNTNNFNNEIDNKICDNLIENQDEENESCAWIALSFYHPLKRRSIKLEINDRTILKIGRCELHLRRLLMREIIEN